MKKPNVPTTAPLRLTVLAALLAGLAVPVMAFAADSTSQVVISQVYGGGGNSGAAFANDFIELFNRSATPVSLAGMSVQYASATGTSWTNKTDLAAVTLQPGQYYLIKEASNAAVGAALPTPDQGAAIAMAAGAGKVALVGNTTPLTGANPTGGALLDLVGYGPSATGFEGSGPTGTISATNAALRAAKGCTDTDSNAADFAVAAVNPRNSATALNVCAGATAFAIVPSCTAFSVQQGFGGSGALSAADQDNRVTGATLSSGGVAGITLGALTASSAIGASASVAVNVAAGVPAATYPLVVNFTNDGAQSASCSFNLTVTPMAAVTHTIPQIQGAGAASPYVDTVQTTEGVITAKVGGGFFMQDIAGDGDPTTSDAVFVNSSTSANVGDLVRVTGTVKESVPTGATRSVTGLQTVTMILVQSTGNSIAPTNIELDGNLANVEGMLVHFNSPLTVNQTSYVGERGELTLANGRREVPTSHYPAGSSQAIAAAAANAANMIILDDGLLVTPTTIPYIGEGGSVRAGDTVSDLTGVVDFGAIGGGGAWFKLQPTVAPVISRSNARDDAPVIAAGNALVASASLLNFFTTFTDGSDVFGATGQGCKLGASISKAHCRGADSLVEFVRQRDKVVNELMAIDADAVGLMEIQNNDDVTVSYLVDQLNAAIGSTTYAVVPKPAVTGSDAIRVAMIYKPAKLSLVGAALSDGDAINNRPPMAQTFQSVNGAKFSLVVNHFTSKNDCAGAGDSDSGDGQGCWNAVRVQQANRLASVFLPQVVAAAGDSDVLVIGDLNSHGFEDPILALNAAGLVNELERFVRPAATPYSFVSNGESGYLDHALASASMDLQMVDVTEWHNNADEAAVIDYNLDGKPQDLYINNAFRASDRDPVVVSLNLTPTIFDVTPSFSVARAGFVYNRTTTKFSGTYSLTNNTGAAIDGPFIVEFDGLAAGISLDGATGKHNGAPYVKLANTSIAPGQTVTIPTVFTNPAKLAISYSAIIYTGTY